MKTFFKSGLFVVLFSALIFSGCAPTSGSSYQQSSENQNYYSPYTSDGVLAEWVDIAIKKNAWGNVGAGVGAVAGAAGGKYVAEKALGSVPFGGLIGGFAGGLFGKKVGENVAQDAFLKKIGGMEKVKATSDVQFTTMQQLANNLYENHSAHEHFQDALNATKSIYPEFANYIR